MGLWVPKLRAEYIIEGALYQEALDYARRSRAYTSDRHDFHSGGLDNKQQKMLEGKLGEKAFKLFLQDNGIRFEEDHSSYEVVILDIGGAIDGIFQMLDMCKRIYMPVLTDPVSVSKISQFENLVRIWDYPQILARTTKMHLPFHGGNAAPENYIEGLLWSELGDYVREILRKERE